MFQIDSSACESASSPAASVGPAGSESVSSGSTSAASGQVSGRCSEYFLPAARCHTVAQPVTSLPVPEVVGTAISVLTRCGVNGLPVASSATRASNSPLSVPTISALAVSRALPPPTATITSLSRCSRQKAR